MIDWGQGDYEVTAAELEPPARHVVELAVLGPGERVLDLATGTGNAALAAARTGAHVTGLDPATRLLDVARARAGAEGLGIQFVDGDALELPFDDGTFDVVLSAFGINFAPDPERAVAEVVRVLRPGGRALLSVFVPEGPIDAMVGVFARGVAAAGVPPPPRFAWHDVDAVRALAAARDATVDAVDGALELEAESPEAYLVAAGRHPMAVAMMPLLERAGTSAALRDEALAALRAGNEDAARFRAKNPYRVIRLTLPA